MGFEHLAKNLLKQAAKPDPIPIREPSNAKSDIVNDLNEAGFSRKEVLLGYREIYDHTEEDSMKKNILDSMSKFHGMMASPDETKGMPQIVIQIAGDNVRVNSMLCPSPSEI